MSDKYSILLVDDEEDILEFLSYSLEKEGYKIFTANDGNKGLMLAKKHCPDLVILDVMMPGMDGIELCDQIRQVPILNDALIIFLTARAEDYSQLAGFDAGADDYITKPVKPKLLISRIKAILRRNRKKQTISSIQIGDIAIDPNNSNIIYAGTGEANSSSFSFPGNGIYKSIDFGRRY